MKRSVKLVTVATVVVALAGSGNPWVAAGAAPSAPPARQVPALPPEFQAAPPVRPASEVEVRQLYRSVLGREADESGVRYWGDQLDFGVSPQTVAGTLARSPESRARYAVEGFQRALERDPTPAELARWSERLKIDPAEAVWLTLVGTAEFAFRAGPGLGALVDAHYRAILRRPADPGGRAYWVNRLQGGASSTVMALTMVTSREHALSVIDDAYQTALFREPDPAGRDHWARLYQFRETDQIHLLFTLAGSLEARTFGCDPFGARRCLTPFPNDYFTAPDPTTPTGRRVAFKPSFMPVNTSGQRVNPTEWNRNDGFSPGQAVVAFVPDLDLAATGAAPVTDIGRSLAADAPIVVIDATTGERHPYWAERDENARAKGETDPALYVRPAVNWTEGHRYVVAMRDLRDSGGGSIAAPPVFAAYRDGGTARVGGFEARRRHMEDLFTTLAGAGVDRSSLYLAWDFTVASTPNLTQRMLSLRDDAMAPLGTGGAPAFTAAATATTADGDAAVVEGTFQVPLYLTGEGAPGSRLTVGPDGLPVRNGAFTAKFECVLPYQRGVPSVPAGGALAVVYGHGLLGDRGEVEGFGDYAIDHQSVLCATDWIGLAEQDIGNAVRILQNLSNMPTLPDRTQQAFLNFQYLARLMKSPQGFASHPAFRVNGTPVIDPGYVAYWGRSQGGVFGGGATAVSTEWTRAVLGQPAINYSTLLNRSVDFDDFAPIQAAAYPDLADRPILVSLMQMLWDRGEGNGYASHMTTDPLPGTPAHTVMLFEAFGDHQVANVATEVEARTIDAKLKVPALAPGRSPDVTPFWGIEPLGPLPTDGNVLLLWDWGTPPPPTANVPNRAGRDPHDFDNQTPAALDTVADYLPADGQVVDHCGGAPCQSPEPP